MHGHVAYQIKWNEVKNNMQVRSLTLLKGSIKRSNIDYAVNYIFIKLSMLKCTAHCARKCPVDRIYIL